MAVPEALTRFPQSIAGLLPGLRQERIGLWSPFPSPGHDSVGAVSDLVISETLQNDLPQLSGDTMDLFGVWTSWTSLGSDLFGVRPI